MDTTERNKEIERLANVAKDLNSNELDEFLNQLPEEDREQVQQKIAGAEVPPTIDFSMEPLPTEAYPAKGTPIRRPSDELKSIGRYTIVQTLGKGGQGSVYRALHPNLPIELAIKVSHVKLDSNEVAALEDEAQVLCELEHPHIARIRDLDFDETGRPFLVLDYVRGRSLAEVIAHGQMPQRNMIKCLSEVAMAIDFAHRRGVLHLDLKPANIVVDEQENPKVIDFGLARMRGAWKDSSLEENYTAGTLAYMSPEQAKGIASEIGPRSDVFSLGAILYHLLTDNPPFQGNTTPELIAKIKNCEFDRELLRTGDVPKSMVDVCLKAMSADQADRFATSEEFAKAIDLPDDKSFIKRWVTPESVFGLKALVTVLGLILIIARIGMFINDRRAVTNLDRGEITENEALVNGLTITHIGNEDNKIEFEVPLFEKRIPREEDGVTVSASFNRPAYCFLFALNPDGQTQLCFPDSPDEVQSEPSIAIRFPANDSEEFPFTDGFGQQVFLLVASDEPLPSFGEWSKDLQNLPRPETEGGWMYSGGRIEQKEFATKFLANQMVYGEGVDDRGSPRKKKESAGIHDFLNNLEQHGDVEVHGCFFDIKPLK